MSNTIKRLENNSNNVVFETNIVDNVLTVMINPDTNYDGERVIGSATALKLGTSEIASGQQSSVSLEGILKEIKAQNPNTEAIVMTITAENYQGPGHFAWNIFVDGAQVVNEDYPLDSWSARMDSFIISLF